MIEVEVKFKVGSLDAVRGRLLELNARFVGESSEVDIYLNHPCRDFAATDEALRVRLHGDGTATVTYKGPRISSPGKARFEVNIHTRDVDHAVQLFEKLGFRVVAKISKKRLIYNIENFSIYLDEVEGLGSFVEIETVVDSEGLIDEAYNSIIRFAESKLGLDPSSVEARTYLELMLERGLVG